MKGYKVFNSDWTCRGFQYKVGETYEMDEKPIICEQGFHFCRNLKDCFYFYPFCKDVKIAEVEALGEIDHNECYLREKISKCCTNKIKILREIPFENLKTKTETKTYHILHPYDYKLKFPIEEINTFWIKTNIPIGLYAKILDKESATIKLQNDNEIYMFNYMIKFDVLTDVKEKEHEL